MANDTIAKIEIVKGKQAPHYGSGTELTLERVVVTERGTVGDLPIVDFVMRDAKGDLYLWACTGRIVNAISSVIKGANMRNHGVGEP